MYIGNAQALYDLDRAKKYFSNEKESFGTWKQTLDDMIHNPISMFNSLPGKRVYAFISNPGVLPAYILLRDETKPPEGYLGYPGEASYTNDQLLRAGYNPAVHGKWMSNQNGHILDTFPEKVGTPRFSELQRIKNEGGDAALLELWRQTPRGAPKGDIQSDAIELVNLFQEYRKIWFSEDIIKKVDRLIGPAEAALPPRTDPPVVTRFPGQK
mgnify:CR=1 FL=1